MKKPSLKKKLRIEFVKLQLNPATPFKGYWLLFLNSVAFGYNFYIGAFDSDTEFEHYFFAGLAAVSVMGIRISYKVLKYESELLLGDHAQEDKS